MSRIKIIDLPKDLEISKKELGRILGGTDLGQLRSEKMPLALQMYMGMQSDILETISKIMKKTSATQDSIIQNLK